MSTWHLFQGLCPCSSVIGQTFLVRAWSTRQFDTAGLHLLRVVQFGWSSTPWSKLLRYFVNSRGVLILFCIYTGSKLTRHQPLIFVLYLIILSTASLFFIIFNMHILSYLLFQHGIIFVYRLETHPFSIFHMSVWCVCFNLLCLHCNE